MGRQLHQRLSALDVTAESGRAVSDEERLSAIWKRYQSVNELEIEKQELREDHPYRRVLTSFQHSLVTSRIVIYDRSGRVAGVYAFSFPDHATQPDGRRKTKVGSSQDCYGRMRGQTAFADAPELLRVWPCDDPKALERVMHTVLTERGRLYYGGAGREWFFVSLGELDEVHGLCRAVIQ